MMGRKASSDGSRRHGGAGSNASVLWPTRNAVERPHHLLGVGQPDPSRPNRWLVSFRTRDQVRRTTVTKGVDDPDDWAEDELREAFRRSVG